MIGIGWMATYGLAVSRLRALLLNGRVRQWLERVTGLALIGFGLALIVTR